MSKIAIIDTNSSANKGSIGRLEGMINCLYHTIPNCKISVLHRYFNENDLEFKRLKNQYPEVSFQKHPWFNEKRFFISTALSFIYNSMKFRMNNLFQSKRLFEYDAFVDLNFIEPEKHVDKFSFINFIGILFVLISLNNINYTKKPVIVCSATIGPYGKFLSTLAKSFLNQVDLITFRERPSLEYTSELGIENPKKILTADLAFLMDPPSKDEIDVIVDKLGIDIKVNLIGITPAAMVNSNFTEENYVDLFSELSNFIIEELGYKIIYLANTYQDVSLIEKISGKIKNSNNIITFPFEFSAPETKGIISLCDLFICSRFHALVASTSLAVPSLGIVSYSHNKFHGILGEMMQQEENLLDIDENFDYDEFLFILKNKVSEILAKKYEISENLKEREKIIKKQVLLNGKLINEIISS